MGLQTLEVSPDVTKTKTVIVGDCNCGKSTLIKRYVQGRYVDAYTPTGLDTYTASYDVTEDYRIQMSVWDTSGDPGYDTVRPVSYSGADLFILCFSVGDPESLQNVTSRWCPEIREHCPDTPVILVGCKTDLRGDIKAIDELRKRNKQPVSNEQGIKAAKAIDALVYSEISSKTSEKSVADVIEVAALTSAGNHVETSSSMFKRRRSSFSRRRFSEIGTARIHLRKEVAKSCVVM